MTRATNNIGATVAKRARLSRAPSHATEVDISDISDEMAPADAY